MTTVPDSPLARSARRLVLLFSLPLLVATDVAHAAPSPGEGKTVRHRLELPDPSVDAAAPADRPSISDSRRALEPSARSLRIAPRLGGAAAPAPDSLVFGSDDRMRVTDTTVFPWNTVTYVESQFSDGSVFGFSGVLVSPYVVITSALAIYQSDLGFAESVLLVPGQTQAREGELIEEPFGFRFGELIEVPQEWVDTAEPSALFGAVFFSEPFDGIERFLPLAFDAAPSGTVAMAGYDQFAGGESNSFALWYREGPIVALDGVFFDHRMDDDPGTLGAPAWQLAADSSPLGIFGFNCCRTSDDSANAGVRLTVNNQPLIEEWLAWTPDDGNGNGGDPDDEFLDDASTDPCVETDTTSCLASGRFEVTAEFRLADGTTGTMGAGRVTDDTGALHFFNPDNVEVFVKVIDACGATLNDRFWIFVSGLTDQEVTLTVRDTVAGKSRQYFNPLGRVFETVRGTVDEDGAFATCP
jgi:V8-like Glu-specific endopeptidase